MNNTQLYLSIGIPSFLVILTWLSNRSEIIRLSDKIDRNADTLRAEMRQMAETLRAEMRQTAENLRAEMITFRKEVHGDLMMLHDVS